MFKQGGIFHGRHNMIDDESLFVLNPGECVIPKYSTKELNSATMTLVADQDMQDKVHELFKKMKRKEEELKHILHGPFRNLPLYINTEHPDHEKALANRFEIGY